MTNQRPLIPLLAALTALWASTAFGLTQTNSDKCSPNVKNGEFEVVVRPVTGTFTCTAGSGHCTWSVSFPLYDHVSACYLNGTFGTAQAYIAGWKVTTVNTNTPVFGGIASQLQHFKVGVIGQTISGSGATQAWNASIDFEEQNQGGPSVIAQDTNYVTVDLEIIALAYRSGLSLTTVTNSATHVSGSTAGTSTTTMTSLPVLFAALSSFDVTTDRDTATTSPQGVNIKKFAVETTVTQSSGSDNIATLCTLQSDLALSSQETSCEASYVVLRGNSTAVSRLTTQPSTTGYGSGMPIYAVATDVSVNIIGYGTTGKHPTCGMKTFSVSADTETLEYAIPKFPHEYKESAFGFRVPDCDTQLINVGQQSKVFLEGAAVWNTSTGAGDQSAGVFLPTTSPRDFFEYGFKNRVGSYSTVTAAAYLELDSAQF
jgi:hypothetical protein